LSKGALIDAPLKIFADVRLFDRLTFAIDAGSCIRYDTHRSSAVPARCPRSSVLDFE
jgi:hypothetical protein